MTLGRSTAMTGRAFGMKRKKVKDSLYLYDRGELTAETGGDTMYKEYEQMPRKGDKVTYCVAFLSARHGVSERKVYEILRRSKRNVRFVQYEKSGTFAFLGEEMNFASKL